MHHEPFDPARVEGIIAEELAKNAHHGLLLEDVTTRLYMPGFIADPEGVRWIIDLAERVTGKQLVEWEYGKRGASEINLLAPVLGKDTGVVIMGPGKQGTYHNPDEYVEVQSLKDYTKVFGEVFSQTAV